MLGALIGMKGIPVAMRNKVLNFDCTNIPENKENYGVPRPDFLNVKNHLFTNIQKLISIRPKEMVKLVYK